MASARSTQLILLVVTACLLLAVGLARLLEARHAPAPDRREAAPAPQAPPEPRQAPAAQPLPRERLDPAELAEIPHTELPLRLLATVVAENAALSLATIADTERHSNAVMREGQAFDGHPAVRLTAIERERVLIDNEGVREQLVLLQAEAAPAEATPGDISFEEREQRRDLARRLRALTDAGDAALGPGERGGLLAEGDVSAVYGEDGELIGVQVDGVRPGGLYDRIGLRNGDVVTDIGGVSLSDPDVMVQVIEQALGSEALELTVQGPDGGATTLQLPTSELQALIAPE